MFLLMMLFCSADLLGTINVCSVKINRVLFCSDSPMYMYIHSFRFDCLGVTERALRGLHRKGSVGGGEVLAEGKDANETRLFL